MILIHNQSKYKSDSEFLCRKESIHQCDDRQPINSIHCPGSLRHHQEIHQTATTAGEVPT